MMFIESQATDPRTHETAIWIARRCRHIVRPRHRPLLHAEVSRNALTLHHRPGHAARCRVPGLSRQAQPAEAVGTLSQGGPFFNEVNMIDHGILRVIVMIGFFALCHYFMREKK